MVVWFMRCSVFDVLLCAAECSIICEFIRNGVPLMRSLGTVTTTDAAIDVRSCMGGGGGGGGGHWVLEGSLIPSIQWPGGHWILGLSDWGVTGSGGSLNPPTPGCLQLRFRSTDPSKMTSLVAWTANRWHPYACTGWLGELPHNDSRKLRRLG